LEYLFFPIANFEVGFTATAWRNCGKPKNNKVRIAGFGQMFETGQYAKHIALSFHSLLF
jgi:hypothetical protein